MDKVNSILKYFTPISLEEANSIKLMNRVDTKFIFNKNKLSFLLNKALKSYRILEINNKRLMQYCTLYYDTDDLLMYLNHHNGKLNRCKLRSRKYIDTGECFLEVKQKINKGITQKKRIKIDNLNMPFSLKEKQFIESKTTYEANILHPQIWNSFSRLTLIHINKSERITIDVNLSFEKNREKIKLPYLAIVEVKQSSLKMKSDFMKLLREVNIFYEGISKYCIGTVLCNNNIKYNQFKVKLLTLKKLEHESNSF